MKQQHTVRLATNDGGWKAFPCTVRLEENGIPELSVPAFRGRWLITEKEMFANVGGNDWRIYTLHPDDCKALTDAAAQPARAAATPESDGGK